MKTKPSIYTIEAGFTVQTIAFDFTTPMPFPIKGDATDICFVRSSCEPGYYLYRWSATEAAWIHNARGLKTREEWLDILTGADARRAAAEAATRLAFTGIPRAVAAR
jgi:hypothetical protein